MDDTRMMILELGSKGYSCAQILLAGGLRLMGRENPDLVRAMAGLAQGVGCSGNICGAVSGGACLIALHTGKGLDNEQPITAGQALMEELLDWFRSEVCAGGEITCDALLGVTQENGVCRLMEPVRCGDLVAKVWEKALALLLAAGIDPSLGREEA